MKSEEKLRVGYNKQKSLFDQSQKMKIQNLEKQSKEIEAKIAKLNYRLEQISEQKKQIQQTSFQSFDEFFRKVSEQSNQTR